MINIKKYKKIEIEISYMIKFYRTNKHVDFNIQRAPLLHYDISNL